jgi:large conductance mechanosensitive channel
MKDFIEEFKGFAMKGNVVDLAVAVVIGTAFGAIVSSLVTNIITPVMGVFMGGIDFTNLRIEIGDAVISYGYFVQSVVDFVVIALVVFMAIKFLARLKQAEAVKPVSGPVPEPSDEVRLLMEIRDSLRR